MRMPNSLEIDKKRKCDKSKKSYTKKSSPVVCGNKRNQPQQACRAPSQHHCSINCQSKLSQYGHRHEVTITGQTKGTMFNLWCGEPGGRSW
jgi:hypothetical protein